MNRPSGRPNCKPAKSFKIRFCDDPGCGAHITAFDEKGDPITEIVQSPSQTLAMVQLCQEFLMEKAVRRSFGDGHD